MNPALASLNIYWQLPILIVVISLVYSATRFDQWSYILREALRWGLRMSLFLVGVSVLLYALSLSVATAITVAIVMAVIWAVLYVFSFSL